MYLPMITNITILMHIAIKLMGQASAFPRMFESIPSAVVIPIIMKLMLRTGKEILHLILNNAQNVTRVAGPVRNGAGAPISQAIPAPMVPIKIVNKVLIRVETP